MWSDHETNSGGRLDWYLVQVHTLAPRSAFRLAHHTRVLAKPFILAMPGWYMYLMQFLDYSLSSWWWNNHSRTPNYKGHNHPAHSTLSPPILLHSFGLSSSSWEGQPWSTNLCTWASNMSLLPPAWLSKAINCPNTPWARGGYQR